MIERLPYNYQQDAISWAAKKPCPAFFMEMRLGKTLVAIRWAKKYNFKRILVVCPLSVVPVWQNELFIEGCSSTMLTGAWKEKIQHLNDQDTFWYITNYESLYRQKRSEKPIPSRITQLAWDCVILDESTYIKNPKAIRTKMCHKFSAEHRAILTGLPNPEGPLDYFEQMKFLNGWFIGCGNFWKFRHRFFHQGYNEYEWLPNKNTVSLIKKQINKHAFILSRKQAKIGSKKIYEQRYVELPSKIRAIYKELENDFCLGRHETKWTIVVKIWLARLAGGQPEEVEYCSSHKIKEVLYLLQTELKKEQCIIWFRFNSELMQAHHKWKTEGITNDFITGETVSSERENCRRRFNKGNFRCLLMQIKCGKFGIDCSGASTAIYFSNSFSYEERIQSEDRIINPEKKEPVLILDILTRNTIDEDVYKALRDKKVNVKIFNNQILKNLRKRNEGYKRRK